MGVECRLWHNYFSTRGSFRWEHSKTDERFFAGRCKFLVVASSQSFLFHLAVFLSHNRIIVSSRRSFRRALMHFAACCFALFCLGLVLRLSFSSFIFTAGNPCGLLLLIGLLHVAPPPKHRWPCSLQFYLSYATSWSQLMREALLLGLRFWAPTEGAA